MQKPKRGRGSGVGSNELDLGSHRRAMSRFVWFIVAALFISSNLIPLAAGLPPPMPVQSQFIALLYLAVCFILSSWQRTYWISPHLLLLSMAFLFAYLSVTKLGINTPISHFLPLIPALGSLVLPARYSIAYGMLVSVLIVSILIFGPTGDIHIANADDIQNGATLILSTIVITAGCYYVALFDEKLLKTVRGKSSYDDLTNLPNKYSLRKRYDSMVARAAKGSGAKYITLVSFGVDGFAELNKIKGSQDGDIVLADAAHCVASMASRTKNLVVGRSEGVSFTVIFPGYVPEQAEEFAKKAQQGFDALKIAGTPGHDISLSAVIVPSNLINSPPTAIELLSKTHYFLTMSQSYGSRHIQVHSDFAGAGPHSPENSKKKPSVTS